MRPQAQGSRTHGRGSSHGGKGGQGAAGQPDPRAEQAQRRARTRAPAVDGRHRSSAGRGPLHAGRSVPGPARALLRGPPAGPSCRALLPSTPAEHSCRALLSRAPAEHSCRGLLPSTPVEGSCRALLSRAPAHDSCRGLPRALPGALLPAGAPVGDSHRALHRALHPGIHRALHPGTPPSTLPSTPLTASEGGPGRAGSPCRPAPRLRTHEGPDPFAGIRPSSALRRGV